MAKKKTHSDTDLSFPFTLNALPDIVDFRDTMFIPTLREVPHKITLDAYKILNVPVLNQGKEGSCTGYALATVTNYLGIKLEGESWKPVSPEMFYYFAKRYDEWPGEKYDGSSARGAMKAWQKHGVCNNSMWEKGNSINKADLLEFIEDAKLRPLGAYFRVKHKDLVAMHCALTEAGILYATTSVHEGWRTPDASTGLIPFDPSNYKVIGGHAVAIVGFDNEGFWIQNSWDTGWGSEGFGKIMYDDWLLNGNDVWVARMGAPVNILSSEAKSRVMAVSGFAKNQASYYDLRPHIISIGNNGGLNAGGTYGNREEDINGYLDMMFNEITKNWKNKRILLYVHGGLVPEESVLQRLTDYRKTLLDNEIFPLFFVWHTAFWDTIKNMLEDALSLRKSEGFFGGIKDFMLDRLDDMLEPVARKIGMPLWDEIKENALLATTKKNGGARLYMDKFIKKQNDLKTPFEIHMVGHSAGSIFLAPLVQYLAGTGNIKNGNPGKDISISTCTLWAPACTCDLYREAYQPSVENGKIGKFSLYTLTDKAEQHDNCAGIYNKSLLYLVSNALEETPKIPFVHPNGTPICGMQKFLTEDLLNNVDWINSPDSQHRTESTTHGGFDNDIACVKSTMEIILKFSNTKKTARDEMIILPSSIYLTERKEFLSTKI